MKIAQRGRRRRLIVLPLIAVLGLGVAGCDTGEAGIGEDEFADLENRVGTLEEDFGVLEEDFNAFEEEAGLTDDAGEAELTEEEPAA